jgi:hypothetical protein
LAAVDISMPAARGEFVDDDTPDYEDGEAQPAEDGGAQDLLGATDAAERAGRRDAVNDQDPRAREAWFEADEASPMVQGLGKADTGNGVVATGDAPSLAQRISDAAHHFEMVGGTSAIKSVEIVTHTDGQVTANVVMAQEYADGLEEFMDRMRSRMGRFKVSRFRVFLGDTLVAETKPEQEPQS